MAQWPGILFLRTMAATWRTASGWGVGVGFGVGAGVGVEGLGLGLGLGLELELELKGGVSGGMGRRCYGAKPRRKLTRGDSFRLWFPQPAKEGSIQ